MEMDTFLQFVWGRRYAALIMFHTWLIVKLVLLRDISGLICILDLALILDVLNHVNAKHGFWKTMEKKRGSLSATEVAIQTDEEPPVPFQSPNELPSESIGIQTDTEVFMVQDTVGVQTDPPCDETDAIKVNGTVLSKDRSTEIDNFYMGLDLDVLIRREIATQTDDPPLTPAQTRIALILGSPPRRFVKPSPCGGPQTADTDFLVNEALCEELELLQGQLESTVSEKKTLDEQVKILSAEAQRVLQMIEDMEVQRDQALDRTVAAQKRIMEQEGKAVEWRRTIDQQSRTIDQQSKIIKDLQDQLNARNDEITVANLDFDDDDIPLPKKYQDLKDSYEKMEEMFSLTIEENENLEKQVQTLNSEKSSLEAQVKSLDAKNADLSEEVSSARNAVTAKDTEMEDLLGSFNGKIKELHTGLQNENSKFGLLDISLPTTFILDASLNISQRGPLGNTNLMDWEGSQNLPLSQPKIDGEVQAVVVATSVWTQTDNIPSGHELISVVVQERAMTPPTLTNLKKRKEWVNSAEKSAVAAKHVRFAPGAETEDRGNSVTREKFTPRVLGPSNFIRQPANPKRNTVSGGGATNVHSFVSQVARPGFSRPPGFSPKPFKMPSGVTPAFQFKLMQPTPEQRQQQKEGLIKVNQYLYEQQQHNNSMRNGSLIASPSYHRNYSSDQFFFRPQKG